MAGRDAVTEWTGRKGKLGAILMASPVRGLEEALLGRSSARLMKHALSSLAEDAVVLDAGCGSGYLSLPIASKLREGTVICVDLSDEMLEKLGKRARSRGLLARIRSVKAPVDATGLEDAVADMVVSNNLLHELRDPHAAVMEWKRVLKPGGRIALSDYRSTRLTRLIMRHGHGAEANDPFDVEGLASLLEEAGFEDVLVVPCRNKLLAQAAKPDGR
ncbi:MAG: class I SAM-dependent methyltransferase [Actinobacteria bacterium]|nr:class I SAM-dependent methyltransferase [Actinomycetota bacterium]